MVGRGLLVPEPGIVPAELVDEEDTNPLVLETLSAFPVAGLVEVTHLDTQQGRHVARDDKPESKAMGTTVSEERPDTYMSAVLAFLYILFRSCQMASSTLMSIWYWA